MFKNLLTALPTRRKSSNTNTAEVTLYAGRAIRKTSIEGLKLIATGG